MTHFPLAPVHAKQDDNSVRPCGYRDRTRGLAFAAVLGALIITFTSSTPDRANAASGAAIAPEPGYYDSRFDFTGTHVPAPRDIHIAGMNPFRENWTVATTTKDIAPPDLSFLNVSTAATGTKGGAELTSTCTPSNGSVVVTAKTFQDCLGQLTARYTRIKQEEGNVLDDRRALLANEDAILKVNPDLRSANTLAPYESAVENCILQQPPQFSQSGSCVSNGNIVKTGDDAAALRKDYGSLQTFLSQITISEASLTPSKSDTSRLGAVKTAITGEANSVSAIADAVDSTIVPMTIHSFVYESSISCGGLFNHGLESDVILTLAPAQGTSSVSSTGGRGSASSVDSLTSSQVSAASKGASSNPTEQLTVTCAPPVFLSLGFGIDGLSGTSYSSVAANTAGQPAPAPSATPVPSTIQQNGGSQRAVALTLANFQLTPDDGSTPTLYGSLGVGTAIFGGSGKVDLLGGFSIATRRSFVITFGAAYGQIQSLASGYSVNGFIAPGTQPPVVTSTRFAPFIAITFGK